MKNNVFKCKTIFKMIKPEMALRLIFALLLIGGQSAQVCAQKKAISEASLKALQGKEVTKENYTQLVTNGEIGRAHV